MYYSIHFAGKVFRKLLNSSFTGCSRRARDENHYPNIPDIPNIPVFSLSKKFPWEKNIRLSIPHSTQKSRLVAIVFGMGSVGLCKAKFQTKAKANNTWIFPEY